MKANAGVPLLGQTSLRSLCMYTVRRQPCSTVARIVAAAATRYIATLHPP